jgi:hypothetical protein
VTSVADPGSGAFLDPGIRKRFFPDPGSQTYIFESLVKNFFGKFYNSVKIGQNFFLQHFKNKFMATKKGRTTYFFSSLSFVAVFGSGIEIWDPG